MNETADLRIFEDELFTVDHSSSCVVPGYVLVRLKGPATSLSELAPLTAEALGRLLSRVTRAIEEAVGADRVYCLSFAELDRRLHFHLFPRTPWLLDEYWRATESRNQPINGPLLFEWARTALAAGGSVPVGAGSVASACAALRDRLGGG
ncbi:MAG: HIT family protein [Thermoanaerobaculaceae bacterium]|nr:HIT family protein [Thermoanaerobaculaceae bacterium]